jgi:hypothetical protein
MTEKESINLADFDFGFTLVDSDELEEVQQIQQAVTETEGHAEQWQQQAEQWRDKAQTIYNSIQPLLNNLAQSPEKEYILWPDRVEKINAFKLKLMSILED